MTVPPSPGAEQSVVLVSGLSGAGKASVLRALEDIGYEAVDNPPLPLLEDLVRGARREEGHSLAVGIDARTRGFDAGAVLAALDRLRSIAGVRPELVFLTAEDGVLQRRFTQTRRRHPLAGGGGVRDGIAVERELTQPLRVHAEVVIDTTELSLADLRRLIEGRFGGSPAQGATRLTVSLISFAFPVGLPREADMVLDVRFLANPHYVDALRDLTGLDEAVAAFLEGDAEFRSFFGKLIDLLRYLLPRFVKEGKKYVTIALGCTGGRHRSVHAVQRLACVLRDENWWVTVLHRELVEPGIAPGGFSRIAADRPAAYGNAEKML